MNPGEFSEAVERAIRIYEELIGEYAARTRHMIEQYGPVPALERLVVSSDLQRGSRVLRDKGRLSDSFEALVVNNRELFGREAVTAAQWRIDHADELP